MINSLLTTALLCLGYGTPLREAEPVNDEAMTATCLTEDYTSWTGYYREQVLSYDGTRLEISGGESASDNYSRVFLPCKLELRQADSSGNLGIKTITYAEYRFPSSGSEVYEPLIKKSPMGGLFTIHPMSRVLVVGAYGYAPKTNRDYEGEYSSVSNSRTLYPTSLPNYMGQDTFNLTDVSHYNYVYLRPNNGYLTDLTTPLVNYVKAQSEQYSQGFGDGRNAGYTQGYQEGKTYGMQIGADGAGLENVFALITRAFEPVSVFFNMRLFGFLPLYWVFLAPLFIALITLLLRMVKH